MVAGEKGGQNPTAARGIVVRLTTDAKLDDTFGTAGVVSLRFGSIDSTTTGMAIQSDEKIVVSGHGVGAGNGLVARLDTDGSLDTTFGSGGFIVLFPNRPGPLVIQSDGKIVIARGAAVVPALPRFTSVTGHHVRQWRRGSFGFRGQSRFAARWQISGRRWWVTGEIQHQRHALHDLRDSRTSSDSGLACVRVAIQRSSRDCGQHRDQGAVERELLGLRAFSRWHQRSDRYDVRNAW